MGGVNNSIGNREAKEIIFTTHGRELRGWENAGVGTGAGQRRDKGEKQLGKL